MDADELVRLAEEVARTAHAGQFRRDGVRPYVVHPEAVASRVGDDPQAVAVAWLHDARCGGVAAGAGGEGGGHALEPG